MVTFIVGLTILGVAMCFNVSLNLTKPQIESRVSAKFLPESSYQPSFFCSAFSYPFLPVISASDTSIITMKQWGLVPSGTSNVNISNDIQRKILNARVESLIEKPAFKMCWQKQRCVVILNGFFEWQHRGSERIPWFVHMKESEVMLLAAVYYPLPQGRHKVQVGGGLSILTTRANTLMGEIHNSKKRMPVILNSEMVEWWMKSGFSEDDISHFRTPVSSNCMTAYTVSPLVNYAMKNRNVPSVLEPYKYSTDLFGGGL